MEEKKILDLVYENQEEWTDEQIGEFVRRALTEDINQYDLEKDIGVNRRSGD
jgi:D-tyrosyl-tRNA(Tyr) deacylase